MKGYYEVKLNMEEADSTVKRWWLILKWDNERLINFYTKHLINKTGFNPIDNILNFVTEYNCEQSKTIKRRFEMIVGQAILNAQQVKYAG